MATAAAPVHMQPAGAATAAGAAEAATVSMSHAQPAADAADMAAMTRTADASSSASASAVPPSARAAFQSRRRSELEVDLRVWRQRLAEAEAAMDQAVGEWEAAEAAAAAAENRAPYLIGSSGPCRPGSKLQRQLQSERGMVHFCEWQLQPDQMRKIGRRAKVIFENQGHARVQLYRRHPLTRAAERVCRLEHWQNPGGGWDIGVECRLGDQFFATLLNPQLSYPVTINGSALWALSVPDRWQLQAAGGDGDEPRPRRAGIEHHEREKPDYEEPDPMDCYDKY